MGYDLTITRTPWSLMSEEADDADAALSDPILLSEWEDAIKTMGFSHPEDYSDPQNAAEIPGWEGVFTLYYNPEGDITVRGLPVDPALAWPSLWRFSVMLGAQLVGDDGELYREDGSGFEPGGGCVRPPLDAAPRRMPWSWRRRS